VVSVTCQVGDGTLTLNANNTFTGGWRSAPATWSSTAAWRCPYAERRQRHRERAVSANSTVNGGNLLVNGSLAAVSQSMPQRHHKRDFSGNSIVNGGTWAHGTLGEPHRQRRSARARKLHRHAEVRERARCRPACRR